MSARPQTKAEKAAAEALSSLCRHTGPCGRLCAATKARAVVAAVRPLIEAEALDDMADRFETFGTLVGEQAWPFVTDLRTSARSRRSALEGEQDHA